MTDTPASDLRTEIERMEEAYEFFISYAGEGVNREAARSATDQVSEYVVQFDDALGGGIEAAREVAAVHDSFDTDAYRAFVDDMSEEVEEARRVLALLAEQGGISSQMVDNLNGMSVFQSVLMKFFFLDELTTHLERPGSSGADGADDGADGASGADDTGDGPAGADE